VSKPDGLPSAVVLSGGKQYRVAPGDRILVDRLSAEAGSSLKLGHLVLFSDGAEVKVGAALEGLDVDARVIAHRRGPRIESIRYKSKKRVRVHHGGRAHLTALEIIAVGGIGLEKPETADEKAEGAGDKKPKRGRAKAAPKVKKAAKAEVVEEPAIEEEKAAPKKTTRRRTKKETE
jgi:large subunit ribosomal protein L21